MRKFLLSLMAMAFSASAMAYVPFIEEGRVWEYVHVFNNFYNLRTVCRKFDGKTTVNGKEYSRFVTFAQYSYPDGRLGGEKVEISDASDAGTYYFREEGETVYALMRDGSIAHDIDTSRENPDLYEAVVFDFSLEEGATFPNEFFRNMTGDQPISIRWQEPLRYGDGPDYRRYTLGIDGGPEFSPEFVEGLGVMNRMFPDFDMYDIPNMTDEYLLTVSAPDGSLMYSAPQYYMLFYGIDTEYVPVVREGRIWEYVYREYAQPITTGFNGYDNYLLFRMKFDGIEIHDGKPYRRLVYTGNIDMWSYDEDGELISRSVKACDNDRVYLMREEDRRVRLLNEGLGIVDIESIDGMDGPEDLREIPVYDFNKGAGESVETGWSSNHWEYNPEYVRIGDFEIESTGTAEIDGDKCLVQTGSLSIASNVRAIEGIGYCDEGFLPFFTVDDRTSVNYFSYNLNRVYDSRGNIIFRGLDIEPGTVSVGAVTDSAATMEYSGGTIAVSGNGHTVIRLYNMTGDVVATGTGSERVTLSTSGLSSGIYVAVAETDGRQTARRKITVR